MRRISLILMVGLIALVIASSGVFAATQATSFSFKIPANLPTQPTGGTATTTALDLGVLAPWQIDWLGDATLSPTDQGATLTGNYAGKIWKYECSADNVAWTTLGTLVDTFSAPAGLGGVPVPPLSGSTTITTRYIRLGYDAQLTSLSANASASGSGSMLATRVPEPGTILAALSILGPVGFVFRRRK